MKIIRVTMTIEFPEDRLSPEERQEIQPEFDQLKREMQSTAPEGTTVVFGIEFGVER